VLEIDDEIEAIQNLYSVYWSLTCFEMKLTLLAFGIY